MELTSIKGIGEKTAELFAKVGITKAEQLPAYYPRTYDYFEVPSGADTSRIGELQSVAVTVLADPEVRHVRGLSLVYFSVSDGENVIKVTFFNAPYLKKSIRRGNRYVMRGVLNQKGSYLTMSQPKLYKPEEYESVSGTWQPIYSTTKGLSSAMIMKTQKKVFQEIPGLLPEDPIPKCFREKNRLWDYSEAAYEMHFPENLERLAEARRSLVYQELFLFAYHMHELKKGTEAEPNHYPMVEVADAARLIERLPYRLTQDQEAAYRDIVSDLEGARSMSRLVQGDVGSGKTILAILALLICCQNGYQGAFMAPTEVLASQHFETIRDMIGRYDLPFRPVLLTGSLKASEKKECYRKIESGEANLIIGTHALFQEKAVYRDLALVITDEQHRFGVKQRQTLAEKGAKPHILVMSATPIPRTLAMILYGDLDLSVIRQMPDKRLAIKNCVVGKDYRPSAYQFIQKEVSKGHQAYVICPMVDESELPDVENVVEYASKLRKELGEAIRVSYLHGKMKAADKNRIMNEFAEGKVDVLVSTTVIEVGINVPNATVMLIENAERFGLAQLHQLRGRVGRGDAQSYCIFMHHRSKEQMPKRLEIMNRSTDGFYIAEQDMKLRGPGDLFGVRQSGGMEFALADIYQDSDLVIRADEDVKELFQMEAEKRDLICDRIRSYLLLAEENQVDFRSI